MPLLSDVSMSESGDLVVMTSSWGRVMITSYANRQQAKKNKKVEMLLMMTSY